MGQLEPLCGPSVNYSHIFLLNWQTLKTTKRGLRRQSTLPRTSNGDLCSSMGTCRRSFDATVQLAPLIGPSLIRSPNEQTLKTTTCELQRISNGDLLCSGKGSCRRSFLATVQLEPLCGLSLNCCYLRSHRGQAVKSTKSELQLQSALQRISNGDPLCLFDKGPCRRSFDAGLQYAQLALHGPQVDRCAAVFRPYATGHLSKASHSQCRPGPKSGVSSWLRTFFTANLFTRSHGVRVPALSAGAGGSSTFIRAVPQQVLKQAEIQALFLGNQVLLTPVEANCQTLSRVSLLQTLRSFRYFQIPDECLAADHHYLVPNADRKLAAATYPILGWDGPHWVPAPRMLRDVVWILTCASLQVTVSKCEKAVFRRCSAA